jgi:general secretion pathway protein D
MWRSTEQHGRHSLWARMNRGTLHCCAALFLTTSSFVAGSVAQERHNLPASMPDSVLHEALERQGSLTLRDTTLVEALFALRQQWQVDMVTSSAIDGEVSATFVDTSLREILDSLLISRGYGYQVVGRSIVVLPLDQLGAFKPMFGTDVIALKRGDPEEMLEVVELLLSPQGKALALKSPRSVLVMDYPDRMRMIRERLEMLDASSVSGTIEEVNRRDDGHSRSVWPAQSQSRPASATVAAANPPPVELDVRVFRPQYVKVDVLLPAIESLISDDGRVAVLQNEDQIVVADRVALMDVIEEAVAALDRPRSQVRIWAMIYDCSLEDVERVGVNWNGRVFGRSRRADGMTPADQIALNSLTAVAPPAGAANGALTLMSMGSNVDVTAVINALKQSNDSRLLADPNVVVTNHEPAKIEIVTEIPYQQLTQGLQGGSIGTTAFREAGVTLEVTPHIARDGTIAMLVNPRFSVLSGFTENDQQPIIDRREAKTTVRVMNGETFVLGGLRQRSKVKNNSGVPWLKDVKYVGKLFRSRDETFRESELLVFITPEIISVDEPSRPREAVAAEHGFEALNRNRRAVRDDWNSTDWDPQSFGGPLRGTQHFGEEVVPRLTPAQGDSPASTTSVRPDYDEILPDKSLRSSGGEGFGEAILFDGSASTELPGRVRIGDLEREPLTRRLMGTVPVSQSSPGRSGKFASQSGAAGSGLPTGGGLPGGIDLKGLLDLLPMGGGTP